MLVSSQTDISQLFSSSFYYEVPMYQRKYAWEKEQCNDLWEDLQAVLDDTIKNHFLSTIVLHECEGVAGTTKYMIADGQQRLTTVSILLLALHTVTKKNFSTLEDPNLVPTYNDIINGVHDILRLSDLQRQLLSGRTERLKLQSYDAKVFGKLLNHGLDSKNPSSKIEIAFNIFTTKIQNKLSGLATQKEQINFLGAIKVAVLHKLPIVRITTDDPSEIHSIFESLNNRGIKLQQIDLVKNYLMMQWAEDVELYEKYWESYDNEWWDKASTIKPVGSVLSNAFYWFLWARAGGNIPSPEIGKYDKTYKYFLSQVKAEGASLTLSEGQDATQEALKIILGEFKSIAERYKGLHNMYTQRERPISVTPPKTESEAYQKRKRQQRLEEFVERCGDVSYSWMVIIWLLLKEETLPPEDFLSIIKMFETFIIRKRIANTSNVQNAVATMIHRLNKAEPTQAKQVLINRISDSRNKDTRLPSDKEVLTALSEGPINLKLARTLLYVLEESHEKRGAADCRIQRRMNSAISKGRQDTVEIEHILPESWEKHWSLGEGASQAQKDRRNSYVGYIGNLLLLHETTNKDASNKSFTDKMKILRNSKNNNSLFLSLEFLEANHSEWNETLIKERSVAMTNKILEMWPSDFLAEASHPQVNGGAYNITRVKDELANKNVHELYLKAEGNSWTKGTFVNIDGQDSVYIENKNQSFSSLRDLFSATNIEGNQSKKGALRKIYIKQDENKYILLQDFLGSTEADED